MTLSIDQTTVTFLLFLYLCFALQLGVPMKTDFDLNVAFKYIAS